jgi:hypothetical protein
MANPFQVAVPNILEALMQGEQGYKGMREMQTQRAQEQARLDAAAALQSGDPNASRTALARLIGGGLTGDATAISNMELARSNADWQKTYQGGMLDVARQTAARKDAPTVTEIYDEVTGQPRKVAVTSGGVVPIGGVKAPAPKTKDLPFGVVKELGERGASYGDFTRLTEGFNDNFGGYRSEKVGDVANWAARNLGVGNEEASTWWQDYQGRKNLIRNQLFGSALTVTEKNEFDKANINPGMTPQAIKANLKIQREATQRAAAKLAKTYVKMGYEPDQIEAALGVPLAGLGISAPARDAIDRGADRKAVIDVLRQNGIDPAGI